jgi:hypothetical protein
MPFGLVVSVRTTAKAGNTDAMNEDAAVVSAKQYRIAIADGASESWESGPWAKTIATAYIRTLPEPATFPEWMTAVRQQAPQSQSQSWYAEAKQLDGSFATLLGLNFEAAPDGGIKWRSVAVGDSCLFHVRNGKLLAKFPLENSSDFSNAPQLIGSRPTSLLPDAEWFAGRAELGDRFFLLTDAVAEWCLRQTESNVNPWTEIQRVTTSSQALSTFPDWVQYLRDAKTLRNDDSTIVSVQIIDAE